MNSSTVLKKTLPLIVILLIIIGVAVTCTALNTEKDNPVISNAEEVYLTANEGDLKYEITKGKMFDELKANVGLATIITDVNIRLLTEAGFYNEVKAEDIAKEIETATFEDGKEGLTEEEIAEKEKEFEETMFTSYGLKNKEEIEDHYRLILAKKAYALSKLEEAIKEKDEAAKDQSEKYFPDSKYTTYYNANYQQEFWAIIVPFTTEAQANNALAQLGIKVHKKDSSVQDDFDRWVKVVEGEEVTLTPQEVVKAMIDMYNTVYSYKLDYPTERITLNEGKQYTFNEFGNYVFNTTLSEEDETLNVLHYEYDELASYQTTILNSMRNTWVSYNANSEVSANAKWYTPVPLSYNSGSLYCFTLKIAEQSPKDLEDVKDEITEALKEAELTTKYIETKMAELRAEKNFTIYDTTLEANYISSMTSYSVEHKKTKVEQESIIASIDGKEYTTEELFALMDEKYGASTALSLLNYERYMINDAFNKYYDYLSTESKEKNKWLDVEKYKELKEEVANEKLVFTSGTYESYGYSPDSMTWIEFIQAVYGAKDENQLLIQFLYNDVVGDFQKTLSDLSEATAETPLWNFYLEKMETIKDEFFSVEGVHLLICVYNDPKDATSSSATPVDPEEWSEEQIKLAKELHDQVLAYIGNSTGTIQEKLKNIADAFNAGLKFLPTLEQNVEAQPVVEGASYVFENIEVAKFRTAGLNVKYEDLKAFTNGKMVEAFDKAVKSIWDANPDSEEMVIYEQYLQTEFGFHVYANLKTIPLTEWTNEEEGNEEEKGILPTLEMIQKYIKDSSDEELTDSMIDAIETYYQPIQKELAGSYNTYIEQYKAVKELSIDLSKVSYSQETWDKTIDLAMESWLENIVYNK